MNPRHIQVCGCVLGSVVMLIVVSWAFRGCGRQTRAVPWASGTTIIPGAFGWDAETDGIVDPLRVPVADLWWEMVSETQRYLTPTHGAVAAVVKGRAYEQVDAAFVDRQRMQTKKIDAGDKAGVLDPGVIIVFRTADGTLGKLQVVGYRRLRDLSFPQAGAYSDAKKQVIAQTTNIERGHLEVKWQLYRTQTP